MLKVCFLVALEHLILNRTCSILLQLGIPLSFSFVNYISMYVCSFLIIFHMCDYVLKLE